MLGRRHVGVAPRTRRHGRVVLELVGVGDGRRFGPVDLHVHEGEIVGVAGVEGNGQTELVECLLGVRPCRSGTIVMDGVDVTRSAVGTRLRAGLGHVAEDRHAAAVAEQLDIVHNAALGMHRVKALGPSRYRLSPTAMRRHAIAIVDRAEVRATSLADAVGTLSGGNQQKLVVGRELARQPRVLVAVQPTRGLDVRAATAVHERLGELCELGGCVLLVSLDLAELLSLADRLVVMRDGRIRGEAQLPAADVSRIGAWMVGAEDDAAASIPTAPA